MGEAYPMIHVAVDIKKKKIVSLEVTSEEVHDGTLLKKLVVKGYTRVITRRKGIITARRVHVAALCTVSRKSQF
jgi:hypothetical protein